MSLSLSLPHCLFALSSQLMSEKVGGAEGTKLDEDFKDLERRADITSKALEVINKTSDLQPNPATRAKLSMLNTVSKIRGQVNSPGYPQPEGLLGGCQLGQFLKRWFGGKCICEQICNFLKA
uniref:BAR domain-containing protein n=1 Tax=Scophthalmus maximus TaxID=52904 RepID=A0A8D3DQJ4_SCOMX